MQTAGSGVLGSAGMAAAAGSGAAGTAAAGSGAPVDQSDSTSVCVGGKVGKDRDEPMPASKPERQTARACGVLATIG